MAAQFNHTIVWSSDQTMSAQFLAEMLVPRVIHIDG